MNENMNACCPTCPWTRRIQLQATLDQMDHFKTKWSYVAHWYIHDLRFYVESSVTTYDHLKRKWSYVAHWYIHVLRVYVESSVTTYDHLKTKWSYVAHRHIYVLRVYVESSVTTYDHLKTKWSYIAHHIQIVRNPFTNFQDLNTNFHPHTVYKEMRRILVLILACIAVFVLTRKTLAPLDYYQDRLVRRTHSPGTKDIVARKLQEVEGKLHDLLARGPQDCPKFERIRERWNGKLYETAEEDHPEETLAYSVDKGKSIHICVLDTNGNVAETNAMLFVAIHELAHVAEIKWGHGPSFFKTMQYLLEVADALGIYTYQDHATNHVSLCGRKLGHNPLTCVKDNYCQPLHVSR
jgi:hypothetical protein